MKEADGGLRAANIIEGEWEPPGLIDPTDDPWEERHDQHEIRESILLTLMK